MRSLLFLICSTLSAQDAQPTFYADLSGPWRISTDDNPRYAEPAFDDSNWATANLPWDRERPIGVYWLRKTITLPPTGRDQLAITIGSVNETYELYVNGVRIASTPGFGTDDPPYFQPRAFPLPAAVLQSGQAVIALRIWRPKPVIWIRQAYSADFGPYRIALANVADEIVELTSLQLLVRYLPYLAMSPVNLLLGIYLLWTFRTAREWRELFWLGCFCIAVGIVTTYNVSMGRGLVSSNFRLSLFYNLTVATALVSLAEFSITALRVHSGFWRWIIWLTMPASVLQYWSPFPALSPAIVPTTLCIYWGVRGLYGQHELRLTAALTAFYCILRVNAILGATTGFTFLPLEIPLGAVRAPTLSVTGSLIGIALVILTMKRLLRAKSEQQRLAGELEAARQVQQLLIPRAELQTKEYSVEAVYQPSHEVGGDFYQFLECDDNALVIVLGDVSGKGLKAAMLVTLITGALRHEQVRQPASILTGLNRAIAGDMQGAFATCCCVRVEPDGRILIANAGHLAPYSDANEIEVPPGLPLGVSSDAEYETTSHFLPPGGQLTLISDGVVEAANPSGELFGFERTRELSGKSAQHIAITAQAFGQNDDITVVTIRRTA